MDATEGQESSKDESHSSRQDRWPKVMPKATKKCRQTTTTSRIQTLCSQLGRTFDGVLTAEAKGQIEREVSQRLVRRGSQPAQKNIRVVAYDRKMMRREVQEAEVQGGFAGSNRGGLYMGCTLSSGHSDAPNSCEANLVSLPSPSTSVYLVKDSTT